jgi:urease accessory protein
MSVAALLTLTQWLSPAFPLGSFAYSHGLEAAMVSGEVTGAESLKDWIACVLEFGSGRSDAALLAEALAPGADHAALAGIARALAASRERLDETEAQGAALTEAVNALMGASRPPLPLPVALGAAAGGLGLPVALVTALYLQAFASALVLAGVRFLPLGQVAGQKIVADLAPLIGRVAEEAAAQGLSGLGTAAFGADLAAMAHEALEARTFKT